MMQRKFNVLLLLFSLIGGAVGFIIGELLLHNLLDRWPHIIVIGLYFGIMALCIGLACLIAELISPTLNGTSWRLRYSGLSWKLLVPATLVMLFTVGVLLELGYQVNPEGKKNVEDLVLVIDNSGSMMDTDPNKDRLKAAKNLIEQMGGSKRVAVVLFDENVNVLQPFTSVRSESEKQTVYAKIDSIQESMDGTDIGLALTETLKQIETQGTADKGTMVILLSDGFSELDAQTVLSPFAAKQIPVNTIGLSLLQPEGANLLRNIAQTTGGSYYDVSNATALSQVFGKIYNTIGDRTLVTERTGTYADSRYFMIVRITAMVIIGLLIGLALGLVFDNRFLARNFAIGGIPAGLVAGLILEKGLTGSTVGDMTVRFIAALLLAGLIAVFSLVLPIRDNIRKGSEGGSPDTRPGRRGASSNMGATPRNSRNKGF